MPRKKKIIEASEEAVVETPKKDTEHLINATFLNKEGKEVKVSDVIGEHDCWYLNKVGKHILTHAAIKSIARIAGISMNYDVEESPNVVPDYRNELEHIVRVTIHCKAKESEKGGCIHSDERDLTVTGESNRVSTPNRGRGYLRKMAEKRAFDIAVLEHLNLYTSIFSEEESADFEDKKEKEPILMPGTKDFESIVTEINAILNSDSMDRLKIVGGKIRARINKKKYNEKQIKYLKELYQREYGKKSDAF